MSPTAAPDRILWICQAAINELQSPTPMPDQPHNPPAFERPDDDLFFGQLCCLTSPRFPQGVLVKVCCPIAGTACYRVELTQGPANRYGERTQAYALRRELNKFLLVSPDSL